MVVDYSSMYIGKMWLLGKVWLWIIVVVVR